MTGSEPEMTGPRRLDTEGVDAVLDLRRLASLGTINPDGTIHIMPMWFRREGESILIPTSSGTRKARNVRERPRASVMVDVYTPGFDVNGVLIRGRAEILEGAQARAINRTIHLRYVTEEVLQLPAARYLAEGDDVTIRVWMDAITTWDIGSSPFGQAVKSIGGGLPLE